MCDINGCGNGTPEPQVISKQQRRLFLKGLASLPLAAVLTDVELVQAAGHAGQMQSVNTSLGESVTAFVAPAEDPAAPVVVLIHEWWGLNDHIKTMAEEFSKHGFTAVAVDLFGGSVASTPKEAMAQIGALDQAAANANLAAWLDWGRANGNGKVATLGWCFGGGWSLQAAANAQPDAAVVYYGTMSLQAEQIAQLKTPVLGHFGTLDARINAQMVGDFKAELAASGKADLFEEHWYTADHAFANPTGGRYDQDDAQLALHRSLTFLHQHL